MSETSLSTRHLAGLPTIPVLRRLCQSLAMLDAILSPEWHNRFFSFNAHWTGHEMMASMHNGMGDAYFLLFTPAGAIMKGFAHEAPMTPYAHDPPRVWPGVLDHVPHVFAAFLVEPAFSLEDTTFCIWREITDISWQCGPISFPELPDPDGSDDLLWMLDGQPTTYQAFAEDYYEVSVPMEIINHIYQHEPLTTELIQQLNPALTVANLQADSEEIQYPV